MKLTLKRRFLKPKYTIGDLYLNGVWFCNTCEDVVRTLPEVCTGNSQGYTCKCKEKVYGQTAIPAGKYLITLEYSPRFKRILPYLHDVPHFSGILIHSGNDEGDTSGCILVGLNKMKGKLADSRATSDRLNEILREEKYIEIEII